MCLVSGCLQQAKQKSPLTFKHAVSATICQRSQMCRPGGKWAFTYRPNPLGYIAFRKFSRKKAVEDLHLPKIGWRFAKCLQEHGGEISG
jgi:hypothetical protein